MCPPATARGVAREGFVQLKVALAGPLRRLIDDQAEVIGEVRGAFSSLVCSPLGVRRVPVPGRGDRGGGPVVPALWALLPRRRGTAGQTRDRGRPRHGLPLGATVHPCWPTPPDSPARHRATGGSS